MISQQFPASEIRACQRCNAYKNCTKPVAGSGAVPAQVMFVGQNPGKNEDMQGIPFVGQSGKMLNSLLAGCGILREEVYITNLMKCLTPNNTAPSLDSIRVCSFWLFLETELVNPQVIVLMGAPAIHSILGQDSGSVEHLHGRPVMKDGRIYLPCYHPAAALYETSQLRQLYDDFTVLKGLVQGRPVSDFIIEDQFPNPDYREITSKAELSDLYDLITDKELVASDVETVNSHSKTESTDKLWSVQLSVQYGQAFFIGGDLAQQFRYPEKAKVIDHFWLNDTQFISHDCFCDTMVMAYLLQKPQGLKELATRLLGVQMQSYSDLVSAGSRDKAITYLQLASLTVWPDPELITEIFWDNKAGKIIEKSKKPQHINRKIKRILDDCEKNPAVDLFARWHTGITQQERSAVEAVLGRMPENTIADVEHAKAVTYACRDASVTMGVYQKMLPEIQELGIEYLMREIDLPILPLVQSMMDTGFAVKPEHFKALSIQCSAKMAELADGMSKMVGHPFNPSSSDQVAKVVYQELGFKPTKLTPTKRISTDDAELKKVKHPVIKDIISYRGLQKIKGTYADNLVNMAVPDSTGQMRIHTTLKTTRVETGRLSSANPNLQNQPTRTKEGKEIRKGFIAPPGFILAECDLGQIEMRTVAHLSQCKGLIDLFFREGDAGDPHTVTASKIFGVPLHEAKQDKYRYPTKRAGFGLIYMIGGAGLSTQINEYISDLEMAGTPVDLGGTWDEFRCDDFIVEYYKLYPEIKVYQQEQAAFARRHGYVQDMFGRIRYIPEVYCPIERVRSAGDRQAGNMPVTSSAQGIIKTAMDKLWRSRFEMGFPDKLRFLMQIHDSLVFELIDDPQFMKEQLTYILKCMTTRVKLLVPITADVKVGYNWAETKKWCPDEGKK